MVITINVADGGTRIGPAVGVRLATAIPPPLPVGSTWSFAVSPSPGGVVGAPYFIHTNTETNISDVTFPLLVPDTVNKIAFGLGHMPDEEPVEAAAFVKLADGTNIDQGLRSDLTWTISDQPIQEILAQPASTTGGGLTPAESQQLLETHEATFPAVAIDSLTLTHLPGDPLTGFVGASLPFPVWGVIVRMTAIDQELRPETPDGDYFFNSLAVVRIFRGSDLWLRVPIHTSSKIISLFGEGLAASITTLLTVPWLLQMSIQVTFRPRCLGDVFLMRTP